MQLETLLYNTWIPLNKVDVSQFVISSSFSSSLNANTDKGFIIEQFVRNWFERSGIEIMQFPKSTNPKDANGFRFEAHSFGGVNVMLDFQILHEYDAIIKHEQIPYLIEIKSGRWHGIETKIARSLALGKQYFGTDVPLRIFSPLHASHREQITPITSQYPEEMVDFIDLQYTQAQLDSFLQRFQKLY